MKQAIANIDSGVYRRFCLFVGPAVPLIACPPGRPARLTLCMLRQGQDLRYGMPPVFEMDTVVVFIMVRTIAGVCAAVADTRPYKRCCKSIQKGNDNDQ